MEIEKLFQGPGLVIDDKVYENSGDSIVRIVDFLESKGIPLAKYNTIQDFKGENCRKFSFVLLDWELVSIEDSDGNPIQGAEEASKTVKEDLIKLLKEVLNTCYIPIFIFSNVYPKNIEKELRKAGIEAKDPSVPILIKHKSDLITDKGVLVLDKIREWVDKMPSIYVLKEWENAVDNAKTDTFKSLANTHSWPSIMWNAAHEDHVNESEEMFDLISQNVFGRMWRVSIEKEQLDKDDIEKPNTDDLLNVLSIQRFDNRVNRDVSTTGDFYKIGSKYYVNVRPACDCVIRGDDTNVYLIQAQPITRTSAKNNFLTEFGTFSEKNNEAIIGPLYNKKFFQFFFHSTYIYEYETIKESKIGRILPPFIRHITERYGLYIQRESLPRIPIEAVYSTDEIPSSPDTKDNQDEPG